MTKIDLLKFVLISTLASFLAACGGGGGGADSGSNNTSNSGVVVPPTSAVVVSGLVNYERPAINQTSGALNYSAISALPVRGATVELLSSGSVVASVQTSATGHYRFNAAPGNTVLVIRVRAELKETSLIPRWDVTVRDNTNSDALYVLQSASFNSGAGVVQNLTAASGWGGTSYNSNRSAGPFAILDTIYESQQKVLAVHSTAAFPVLKAFWSVNNNTFGNGQLSDGDIGTSFFTEISSGGTVSERRLYILGRANDDTDEYDSSVVAHEWGHYFQSSFSRDDSTGGSHGGGDDRLDRRIAFSEGWGNAWSGMVLAKNNYSDSSGNSQASGFVLPLNSGYNTVAGGSKGWFRERSIQYILWTLHNQAGFPEMYQALTSNEFRTGTALSDIHSFSNSYRTVAPGTRTTALNNLLTAESINSASDAFGNNETNNGGNSATLPYYRQITALGDPVTLSSGQTLCGTADYVTQQNSTSTTVSDRNKLGLFVYARFTLPSAANYTITVTANPSTGVDTDFELHRGGQRVAVAQDELNQQETLSNQSLSAGDYVLVVYDFNKAAPGNTCYSVSIQ